MKCQVKKKKNFTNSQTTEKMVMKEIIKKIWSCDDKEALRNGLLLCIEHLDTKTDTPEKRKLLQSVTEELAEP